MGTQHAECNALCEEVCAGSDVVKLAAVIALDASYVGTELSFGKSEKMSESVEHLGFKAKRECPQVVSVIIKNDEVIFVT